MSLGKNIRPRRGAAKYPDICRDAKGCNRSHLWMVLEGKRQSEGTLQKYRSLKAQKQTEPAPTKTFAERLRLIMRGMKQVDAARLFQVTQPAISQMWHGMLPSAPTAARIAQATGCDLQWLITGVSSQPATPPCIVKLNELLGYAAN